MKIALVILHADPMRGGAERYTVDLACALAKRGHEVTVLASSFSEQLADVTCVRLDDSAGTRPGRYLTFLESLDGHLKRTQYNIVHAMLPVRQCDVYHPHAGIAAKNVPTGWRRLFNQRRVAMANVEKKLLNSARPPVMLALSEYVRQSIREFYALADARLPILFNAVDLDRFIPPRTRNPQGDRVNALFIGQDFVRKGLLEAIAAMSKLNNAPLHLTIAGRKPSNFHLPPSSNVTVMGEVKDPRPLYADADFFVLPTKHDPCSLVVLEALAMGVPVISTRLNGACEIMTDGVHGFVLPDPKDVDALAEAMRKMLDPALRAKMSAACLELRPRLSYEHHLDQLIQIYQQCAVQSGKKG